jgi:hypothetical protein
MSYENVMNAVNNYSNIIIYFCQKIECDGSSEYISLSKKNIPSEDKIKIFYLR